MTQNSTKPPTLFIENASGKPGIGFPVKINGISQRMTNVNTASISLREFVGKAIHSIEVNGAHIRINPALKVTKNTRIRAQHLMSGLLSYKFTNETSTDSDSNLLTHFE